MSGGTWTDGDGNTYQDTQNGTQNGCDYGAGGVYSAQGAVTATCTWVPDPGQTLATDPPPQCVLVWEEGYAYYEASGHDFDGGTCDDGLDDALVPWDGDIACLTSGSPQLDNVHCHVHSGGPTFTWTRNPSITPGSDGGVCGDLIYSFGVQGFNFPPYVMLPDGTTLRLIALGSPDAGLLGTPGLASAVPYDPSDPFGPDGEGDPAGPLGMTSAHPGTMPGTPQNAVVGGMVQGVQTTAVNVGVVLVTMGGGAVLEGVVDLGAIADGAAEGGGAGDGGGGSDTGGGGGGGGGTTAIGRMRDLQQFDGIDGVDTWGKSGRIPGPGDPPVSWRENQQWLDQRIQNGDSFILVSPESSLSDVYILGKPNGYFTYRELQYLQGQGIGVFHAY